MSAAKVFLDTNILIYFYSEDEPEKQSFAQDVLNGHCCVVSTQVLNEVSNIWFKNADGMVPKLSSIWTTSKRYATKSRWFKDAPSTKLCH